MQRLAATLMLIVLYATAPAGWSQGKTITLATDLPEGPGTFLKHLLPRFSLKTSIRFTLTEPGDPAADMHLTASDAGRPAFMAGEDGEGGLWRLDITRQNEETARFSDWLFSDVGRNTIAGFAPDGEQAFFAPQVKEAEIVYVEPEGDAAEGERLALLHCGRCHVISDKNRFGGIGSSPSFGALRTIDGWQDKFAVFWTLNPHPSFTQVDGMTEPFPPERPPAIAPMELTLDEIDSIRVFVATIQPKDLGAPIASQ